MRIHTLRPAEGAVTPAKRLGRGTGSGLGKTAKELVSSCPGAKIVEGRLLNGNPSESALKQWAESL